MSDPHVVQAARLIRDHASTAVGIEELLTRVPVSRSALFRRFKEHLGRSPKEEMTRVRIERAKELLRNSTLSVAAVAERAGYSEAKHFIVIFRQATGVTPLRYRKQSEVSRAR